MGKKCLICITVKPKADFYYNKKNRKFTSYCKSCWKTKYRYDKYKTTEEIIFKILKKQNNKCCICSTDIKDNFVVDHNHHSKEVRGLLCSNCNTGLGKFKDRIDLLSRAVVFLYERGSYGIKHQENN